MKKNDIQERYGVFGLIKADRDSEKVKPYLSGLHEDGLSILDNTSFVINKVKNMKESLSHLKPELAEEQMQKKIIAAKQYSLSTLKKHIGRVTSDKNALENKILRVTEVETPKDPLQAMMQEMRRSEIRANLRSIEPKYRAEEISKSLERLQACIANPDPADRLISQESLTEMRRQWAFKENPELMQEEEEQKEIYQATRRRAAEINSTVVKMLMDANLDVELDPKEFFETFPPETEYEQFHAERRILNYWRSQNEKDWRKELAEKKDSTEKALSELEDENED